MREILRTNDAVVLSFAKTVLEDAGVEVMQADTHISIMEGSIGVFPRRLLVWDDDWARARQALQGADLGNWLKDD